MFEDTWSSRSNRDTIVLIAYKCLAHMMDPKVNHGYLDADQLSQSMISMNIQGMSLEVSSYSYSIARSSSSSNFRVKSKRQQILETRQMNKDECTASCALGMTLTSYSQDSDEESCVANSTLRPSKQNLTSDEDSGIASFDLPTIKRESTGNKDSDEGPKLRPHPAWLSTTHGHLLLSQFGGHGLPSRLPLSGYFKGEQPFSLKW